MKNLVSIIIPVYNDPNLKTALESCMKQDHSPIEILVVDDGSDMDIESVVESLEDKRIKYFRQKNKGNANICRNIGIKKAKGKYVCFLDSDDLYMKNHVSTCVEILEKEGADGMYCSTIIHNGYSASQVLATLPENEEGMANYLLRKGYGACSCSLFMTRKSALDVKWDETLKRHQDYDFVIRYSRKYQFTVKKEVGCICNTYVGRKESRPIDFDSCIRFTETYKNEFWDGFYYFYLNNMLHLAEAQKAEEEIVRYYKNELVRIKENENNIQQLNTV